VTGGAILARPTHMDDDRGITEGILRQKFSNIAERSFRDLSPLRRSRFHTVWKTCDQRGEFKKQAQQAVLAINGSDDNRGEDERARRD
jgi:hypothetical protein